jgi:hypothetical protein
VRAACASRARLLAARRRPPSGSARACSSLAAEAAGVGFGASTARRPLSRRRADSSLAPLPRCRRQLAARSSSSGVGNGYPPARPHGCACLSSRSPTCAREGPWRAIALPRHRARGPAMRPRQPPTLAGARVMGALLPGNEGAGVGRCRKREPQIRTRIVQSRRPASPSQKHSRLSAFSSTLVRRRGACTRVHEDRARSRRRARRWPGGCARSAGGGPVYLRWDRSP